MKIIAVRACCMGLLAIIFSKIGAKMAANG
jgi:hypothetical protein